MAIITSGSVRRALWLLLAGLVFLGGCGTSGPKVTPVTGKVTYKETAVEGAIVTFFLNGEGTPATGTTKADGTFDLMMGQARGAQPGPNQATVIKIQAGAPTGVGDSMEAAVKKTGDAAPEVKALLPEKYSSVANSGLKYDVKEGQKNHFEIKLED